MTIKSKFDAIRDFYKAAEAEIMAEKPNEWSMHPYEWEKCGIHLTPIESWLWHDIRAVDLVLYPQYPVLGFFVDFANPKAKVVIECDGQAFHQDKAKDAARDKKLRDAGWHVYRITGKDCRDGVDSDTPSQSAARQFIERIASMHNIQRGQ